MIFRRRPAALDTQDHTLTPQRCGDCGDTYASVVGWVHEPDGGATVASYYAACHGHPRHEVALDITLGTWGDDADLADRETFSCLWRPWPDGVMAVDGFVTLTFGAGDEVPDVLGRSLTRSEALESQRLPTVWAVVDALALGVDPIGDAVMSRRRCADCDRPA